MAILSIQSHVAFGHVGNAAAVFPLQRLGHEVWPVHTVMFSNHTGYGSWRGPVFDAGAVKEVLQGIEDRGVLSQCDAVLSGYVGDQSIGLVILDAVERARAANARVVYACDPVMGDVGRGIYVRDGIPGFMRDNAVPAADVIFPNQFEVELLTGLPVATLEQALAAGDALLALGPQVVVITSLARAEASRDEIEMLAVSADGAWLVATPRLNMAVTPNGAGDATAALFTAFYLETATVPDALARTADAVFAIFEATAAAATRELQIVVAQDAIASGRIRYTVSKVR